MEDLIPISELNDFVFCPYSIYLHHVYSGGGEELYHASPQARGKAVHTNIDEHRTGNNRADLTGMAVFSDDLGVYGKIDVYKSRHKKLVERKYLIKTLYRGQIYQLWSQYYCLLEMGYEVENLEFYSCSTNCSFNIPLPDEADRKELKDFIERFKRFDPDQAFPVNQNKCVHCIYCNLCDKTDLDHVYN